MSDFKQFRIVLDGDSNTYAVKDEVARNALTNKVDKVSGKGLSTNDFSNVYKEKLDGLITYPSQDGKYMLHVENSTSQYEEFIVDSELSSSSENAVENKVIKTGIDTIENTITDALSNKAPAIIESASGSVASFSDGADGIPVKSLVAQINPIQDLHGYDYPWPAGGGGNLLPMTVSGIKSNNTAGTWSGNVYTSPGGLTYTLNTDDAGNVVGITVNGTSSGNDVFWIGPVNATANTYYLSANVDTGNNAIFVRVSGPGKNVYTTNILNYYASSPTTANISSEIELWGNIRIGDGATVNNMVFKPYFGLDQTGVFAPYSNICPISGRTGADVTRCGKNLINQADLVQGSLGGQGAEISSTQRLRSPFVKCLPSTTYALSVNSGVLLYEIHQYDSEQHFIKLSTANATEFTITTEQNTAYIRVLIRYSDNATILPSAVTALQLVRGSSASAYEPYSGETYTLTWQTEAGTVYGGYATYLGGGNWRLTSSMAMVDLGTLNWNSAGTYFLRAALAGATGYGGADIPSIISDKKVANSYNALYGHYGNGVTIFVDSGTPYVYSQKSAEGDTSTPDAQLVYELATPLTYTLTTEELTTLLGVNNVWADVGNTTVQYSADTRLYISKKLAEVLQSS